MPQKWGNISIFLLYFGILSLGIFHDHGQIQVIGLKGPPCEAVRFFGILTPALEPQIHLHMRCNPKKVPFQASFSGISKKTGIHLQWGQHILQGQEGKRVLYFMPKRVHFPWSSEVMQVCCSVHGTLRGSNGSRWISCGLWIPEGELVVSIRSIKCPNICWKSMVCSNYL